MNRPKIFTQTTPPKDKKEKEIKDLALAAFLVTNGNPLIKSPSRQNNSSGKLIFVFEDTEKLEIDTLSFYNRTAKVDPLSFSEVFRNLKALTF
jgi:hypothetical protein